MDDDAAWDLLKQAEQIIVAKGKKVQTFADPAENRDEVLRQVMGPSGNLRAPTLRRENRFLIGFHDQAYEEWLR